MKKIIQRGTFWGSIIFTLFACQVQDDSIGVEIASEDAEKESAKLTCEELFNSAEEYAGQEITLNAINWGASPSVDGEEILMSIDDEVLEGLQQAHVLVHFSKDQEKDIKKFEENDSISLTAKVGTVEYGALRLIEAKVSPN